MKINRPYGAGDNEVNTQMMAILKNYMKKNNLNITEINIFEYSVSALTDTGEKYIMSKAEGCRAKTSEMRNYFYMQKETYGKRKRIKKEEW